MAVALVSSVEAAPGADGGTSASIDTSGANFLVLVVCADATEAATTPSDSKGNTWSTLTAQNATVGVCIHYVENPTVGTLHTFTYSDLGSNPWFAAMAFSGLETTGVFEEENGAATVITSTSYQPGAVVPDADGALVITGVSTAHSSAGVPTYSVDSGFTIEQQEPKSATNRPGGAAYLIQGTAASVNPTWSWSVNNARAAVIAVFKASTGAAPSNVPNALMMMGAGL